MESKGWDWYQIKEEKWDIPSEDIYYLLYRWKNLGKRKFLDLGCGKGRHALFFAKNSFEVYALDISPSGIELLKEKARSENLEIFTTVSDMLSLPYENEFFDCILSYHAIYHTHKEGLKRAISEVYRVLKRDGEFYVTFNSKFSKSYGNPNNIVLEDGTIIKKEGKEAGIPHYYIDKEEIFILMKDFEILSMKYIEDIIPKRSNKYFLLARKR
ncbi:MAG: class I SAM-dependent methyltransferase [Dictyoglomaceae bacterium]|nr:class I SAM-dependent methyltransferase [Dictyoglomaceae bacterium]